MNMLGKTLLMSAMAATLTLTFMSAASADDRWHHRDGWVLGGAAGLATGLIVGSAIASQPRYVEPGPVYVDPDYEAPPPPYYYRAPPRRVYVERDVSYYAPATAGLRPWSSQWMRYCYDRYRSFDGRSGTYVGFDGMRHFCTAD